MKLLAYLISLLLLTAPAPIQDPQPPSTTSSSPPSVF